MGESIRQILVKEKLYAVDLWHLPVVQDMPDLEDVDVTEQLIEEEQGTRISISDITESDPGPRPEPEELVIKPKSSQEEGIFSSNSKFYLYSCSNHWCRENQTLM